MDIQQDEPKLPNVPSSGHHTGDKADGAPLAQEHVKIL